MSCVGGQFFWGKDGGGGGPSRVGINLLSCFFCKKKILQHVKLLPSLPFMRKSSMIFLRLFENIFGHIKHFSSKNFFGITLQMVTQ